MLCNAEAKVDQHKTSAEPLQERNICGTKLKYMKLNWNICETKLKISKKNFCICGRYDPTWGGEDVFDVEIK